jgi:uncharacterized membrane protein
MAAKKGIETSSEALSHFDRMALDRLICFSDAVFRNWITLLILNVTVPLKIQTQRKRFAWPIDRGYANLRG